MRTMPGRSVATFAFARCRAETVVLYALAIEYSVSPCLTLWCTEPAEADSNLADLAVEDFDLFLATCTSRAAAGLTGQCT